MRILGAVLSVVLLAVPVIGAPSPAVAVAVAAGAVAAEIPCPKPRIAKPSAPPRPVPPADVAEDMAVGGQALATHGLVVPAGSPAPPALTATTWLVADLDTGEVLGACGPHVHQTPASVQKMLLAATASPAATSTSSLAVRRSAWSRAAPTRSRRSGSA
jgi:D-alanyl-D-alanine carboxypeptidase (penicillin-binding protein 5/6)